MENKLCGRIAEIINKLKTTAAGAEEGRIHIDFKDDAAKQRWEEFYMNEIPNEDSEQLWTRVDGIGTRLMMILALAEEQFEVNLDIVNSVIQFLHYQVEIRQRFRPIDAKNNIARLEEQIRRLIPNIGDKLAQRDIAKKSNAHKYGIEDFNRALKNLSGDNTIAITYGEKNSKTVTRINP